MKVIPIAAAHYCDYFGVFAVDRFVKISRNLDNKISDKNLLRKFAKIYRVYDQTPRNLKVMGITNNSGRIICYR